MSLSQKYLDFLAECGLPARVLFSVFDAGTLERGLAYFRDGNVIGSGHARDGDNVTVTAQVRGSGKNVYLTTINYNEKSPRWITGVCTCPMRSGCKHAVAVLFDYLQRYVAPKQREAASDAVVGKLAGTGVMPFTAFTAASLPTAARTRTLSPIDAWLQNLAGVGKTGAMPDRQPEPVLPPQPQLVYLLSLDARNTELLTVGVHKSSSLKRGGMGKPVPVPLESLVSLNRTRNYRHTPHDLMIAQLLALPELRFSLYWHSGTLTGKVGQQVLEEILKTGQAYWATPETWQHEARPLSVGRPRLFQFQWQADETEVFRIKVVADPPIHQHFWLNGTLWYVDLHAHQCGVLEHPDLTAPQVEKLLLAPPIPAAQAEAVSERLLELLPDADVPAPSPKVCAQIETVTAAMQPILVLKAVTPDNLERTIHTASVAFRYGEHLLRPETPATSSLVKTAGRRWRVLRDREKEQAAVDALADYGFVSGRKFTASLHPLDLVVEASNRTLAALRWNDFLEHGLDDLRNDGWEVTVGDNFQLRFDVVEAFDAAWEESDAGNDWFEISLGFEVEGQRVNLLPILVEMLAQMEGPQALRDLLQRQTFMFVPISDNRWVKLDARRLESIMETLVELYDSHPLNADGNLEFSRFQGANLAALLNAPGMRWKGAEELRALTQKLQNFKGVQPVVLPDGLNASLRPYQHEGVSWLQFLREFQFNGTLADDMGLGKTLQTLTHLLLEKQSGRMDRPSLVIAPTSLMGNWRREAARFTPDLRVQVVHGADRHRHFDSFTDYDVILTTYPLMLRDEEHYQNQQFHYLILDEAQAIKNVTSKTTQVIYHLKARHRLCLTGTPLENHLGELWSMYHFLMPGFLGTHEKFTRLFRNPIEKQGDMGRQQQLRNRVLPFMLRRTKELVASELPPKTEIIRSVALEGKQRDLYETVRLAMDAKVREEISKKGFARSQIMILDALLKLRQVCCDPRLVKLDKAQKVKESAKLELLMNLLPEMLEEGRKILLFSQFTSMLALIEAALDKAGIVYTKLTGQTKNRDEAVAAFQEGDAKVFLISLKAGGTGLNLTAADTVIHYDPWWNPAAEQQATDRAYRIGQDKPVFVYKLITEETVEEKILRLQERKQALADGLYSEQAGEGERFTADDLMDLLQPLEK